MKFLLLFALLPQFGLAQYYPNQRFTEIPITDVLQGEWVLQKIEMINSFDYFLSTTYTRLEDRNQRLVIKDDSLKVFPDQNLRYYSPHEKGYTYNVVYDTLFDTFSFELFSTNKRKKNHIESYTINRCTTDEMILTSHELITEGIDDFSIRVAYTYKKVESPEIIKKLMGEWQLCSKNPIDIFNYNDTVEYVLHTKETLIDCSSNPYHLDISFDADSMNQQCSIMLYDGGSANFSILPFMVDVQKSRIYLGRSNYFVMEIVKFTDQHLILKYDRIESTKFDR